MVLIKHQDQNPMAVEPHHHQKRQQVHDYVDYAPPNA
jgi:hypothetical protein